MMGVERLIKIISDLGLIDCQARLSPNADRKSLIDEKIKEYGDRKSMIEEIKNADKAFWTTPSPVESKPTGAHLAFQRLSIKEHKEIFDQFIDGLDLELQDNGGRTMLFYAVRGGKIENLRHLIDNGANVHKVWAGLGGYSNVVSEIIYYNNSRLGDVRKMLELIFSRGYRPDVNIKIGYHDGTVLSFLIENQCYIDSDMIEITKMLIEHGAYTNIIACVNYTAVSRFLMPGLMQQMNDDYRDKYLIPFLSLLLENGADPNAIADHVIFKGDTALRRLELYMRSCSLETQHIFSPIKDLLIRYGADNSKAYYIRDAIRTAIENDDSDKIKEFIKRGFNVGLELIGHADSLGRAEIVKILICAEVKYYGSLRLAETDSEVKALTEISIPRLKEVLLRPGEKIAPDDLLMLIRECLQKDPKLVKDLDYLKDIVSSDLRQSLSISDSNSDLTNGKCNGLADPFSVQKRSGGLAKLKIYLAHCKPINELSEVDQPEQISTRSKFSRCCVSFIQLRN